MIFSSSDCVQCETKRNLQNLHRFLCFSRFSIFLFHSLGNVASTTSRSRYDKSNECPSARRISKKILRILIFQHRKRWIGNCRRKLPPRSEKFDSSRLYLILIARIFRTKNDLLCNLLLMLSRMVIGQSDRCSQNINLWMWFSFWTFIQVQLVNNFGRRTFHKASILPAQEKRMKWNFIDIGHEHWLAEEKDRKIYPVKNYYVNYSTKIMIIPRLSDTYKSPLHFPFSPFTKGWLSYQTLWWWQKSIENIFSAT